jgi:hypothetical protein
MFNPKYKPMRKLVFILLGALILFSIPKFTPVDDDVGIGCSYDVDQENQYIVPFTDFELRVAPAIIKGPMYGEVLIPLYEINSFYQHWQYQEQTNRLVDQYCSNFDHPPGDKSIKYCHYGRTKTKYLSDFRYNIKNIFQIKPPPLEVFLFYTCQEK